MNFIFQIRSFFNCRSATLIITLHSPPHQYRRYIIIRVLQNPTQDKIDLFLLIFVLAIVHVYRSQKVLVEITIWNIMLSPFASRFEGACQLQS